MKRILVDDDTPGFASMLGERITLYCETYIYTGTLAGVNDSYLELTDAAIVYETGPHDTDKWQDAQDLPHKWCVQVAKVESWGRMK